MTIQQILDDNNITLETAPAFFGDCSIEMVANNDPYMFVIKMGGNSTQFFFTTKSGQNPDDNLISVLNCLLNMAVDSDDEQIEVDWLTSQLKTFFGGELYKKLINEKY